MRRRFIVAGVLALAPTLLFGSMADAKPRVPHAKPAGDAGTEVIGGVPVDISGIPHTVVLLDKREPNPYYARFCTGTIVGRWAILTAAHCVQGMNNANIQVAAGYSKLSQIPRSARREVVSKHIHPQYNSQQLTHDVAVLKVNGPEFPLSMQMRINGSASRPAHRQLLGVAGWGMTATNPNQLPDQVQFTFLNDLAGPSGACGGWGGLYQPARHLCGGPSDSGVRSICFGDSGGPLWTGTPDGGTALVGVNSFVGSSNCFAPGLPSVFARVSDNISFITQWAGSARVVY